MKRLLLILMVMIFTFIYSTPAVNAITFFSNNDKPDKTVTFKDLDRILKEVFQLAQLQGSVNGYELFLDETKSFQSRYSNWRSLAIHNIYNLTIQADLIEGYVYFLENFSNVPEVSIEDMKKIRSRLYQISFEVANARNDLPSYYGFLANFTEAPEKFRNQALDKVVSLECKIAHSKFDNLPQNTMNNKFLQEFEIDKIGRLLYENAISAKRNQDYSLFLGKYQTVIRCDLFKGSTTRFILLRDLDLKQSLDEIKAELKNIKNDLQRLTDLTVKNFLVLNKKNNDQKSDYLQSLDDIVNQQKNLIDLKIQPGKYNEMDSPWEIYKQLGTVISAWLPSAEILIKTLIITVL